MANPFHGAGVDIFWNHTLFYYSFKIIPSLKTWQKYAYLHRSIDVKFTFDSALLGLFRSANILQIADVAL